MTATSGNRTVTDTLSWGDARTDRAEAEALDEEVLKRWCIRYGAPPGRPLELLGTVIGRECAGAVQFVPPEIAPDLLSASGGLQEITDDELWAGLRRLRGDCSFRFADVHGDAGRSLAGMQPKDAWRGRDGGGRCRRCNSGGTPLSYSNLLLSIAVSQWNNLDAAREVHGLVDEMNNVRPELRFDADFVLKAGLMLTDIASVGFKVANFTHDRSSTTALETW